MATSDLDEWSPTTELGLLPSPACEPLFVIPCSVGMEPQSPVHEIVSVLWKALHDLGVNPETADVERWGFSIPGAFFAFGREYHNHDHVISLTRNCEPLEVIAALYHDAVYIQVDKDVPKSMAACKIRQPLSTGAI